MRTQIHATCEIHESANTIIARLLNVRGIDEAFLKPQSPEVTLSWDNLGISDLQFDKAKKRLETAKEKNEQIVVYGDYDVDGITASTILWYGLRKLGYNVKPFLPNRKDEGYGFSEKGISRAISMHNASLIIAVDHGIAGGDYVANLKKKGIDCIVIDHHKKTGVYPRSAIAVLYSPKVSAAGLAYQFMRELSKSDSSLHSFITIDAVALAGMASLTDVMKQEGMSRSLAFHGVRQLSKTTLPGLRQLLLTSGLGIKDIYSSYDIGYCIGPRINAAGRMGDALDAMRALCAPSTQSSLPFVTKLEQANRERQTNMQTQLTDARNRKEKHMKRFACIVSDTYDEGIVGLIAGRLTREWYIPVLVGMLQGGIVKGSARSVDGIDITAIFEKNKDLFITYGGHEKAAGFSLQQSHIEDLNKALGNELDTYDAAIFEQLLSIDMSIDLSHITNDFAEQLELLEPYGEGNEQPLFVSTVCITGSRRVGSKALHIQYVVKSPMTDVSHKAVFFNADSSAPSLGETVQIVYTIKLSTWNNNTKPELHIRHIIR